MKLATAVCSFAMIAGLGMPARAADATMTDQERAQLVKFLKDAQKEFVSAVESLSDEQWKWKPTPTRWSVGECAEHIMLSEEALFSRAMLALKNPADPEWETKTKGKTEFLL